MMNEMKEDGNIDVLFLGASNTMGGYDVSLIENNTELNVYNCGSAAQSAQGSYYLLKYVNEYNDIKSVWLDMSYAMVEVEEAGAGGNTYIITDYMSDKKLKYEYLSSAFGVEGILKGIMPCLHNSVVSITALKAHITGDYLREPYKYITYEYERYAGQGFVYRNGVIKSDAFGSASAIDTDNMISDYTMEYLNRIVEYCNDNDIELVLVSTPIPDATLVGAGDYQAYIDYVRSVAEEKGLEYRDFNLLNEDALVLSASDFENNVHLNGRGADKFSESVSRILNGELDESAFYDTFAEKLANNPDGTAKNH
jgi:hypothetical protein